jgi:methionyl aminopeptidase
VIVIKSPREIELMKQAGILLAKVFQAIEPLIKPGVTTNQIDKMADRIITDNGGVAAFKGYGGFPASICASVNDTLIHGIPNDMPLVEGDIISVDIGVRYKGYHADAARTYPVGKCSEKAINLIDVAEDCFNTALEVIRPGAYVGDIGHAVMSLAKQHGYEVPREYTGHGIGSDLHEDPQVPNYGTPGTGVVLKEGMCLAIEPMVMAGKYHTKVMPDNWTVKSSDGQLSSHYENTILVTSDGCQVLTSQ